MFTFDLTALLGGCIPPVVSTASPTTPPNNDDDCHVNSATSVFDEMPTFTFAVNSLGSTYHILK